MGTALQASVVPRAPQPCARRAARWLHNPAVLLNSGFSHSPHCPQGALPRDGLGGKLLAKGTWGTAVLCPALCHHGLSHPRNLGCGCQAPGDSSKGGRREGKKKSMQFLSSLSSLKFRENVWEYCTFEAFNFFYCWVWTLKQSSFPFLRPNPPPLRNLALNCLRGAFKFYKLPSLKMLTRLWRHSHFTLSFIKS
jgi:hypothetical protein